MWPAFPTRRRALVRQADQPYLVLARPARRWQSPLRQPALDKPAGHRHRSPWAVFRDL
jgi:hypothetical protein